MVKQGISSYRFIMLSALFFTLFHNTFFFTKAWQLINSDSLHDLLFAISLPIVLFSLLNIIFSFLFWPFIRKPMLILFLLVGAAINYFMYTFNVVIDRDMIENALETNVHESTDLVTIKMGIWLLFLGILPAIWVVKVRILPAKSVAKALFLGLLNIVVSLLVVVLVAAVLYKDYASFFRNNKVIVKDLVPSNVVTAVVKLINDRIDANRPFVDIGTDAKKGTTIQNQPKKTLTIFVLGETARAENFALGGYQRDSNPRLSARKDVVYFDNVSSCGTATALSVPCMFSNMTRENYNATTARHQAGVLDVLSHANVNVLWRENDGGCKGVCDRVESVDMTKLNLDKYCQDGYCYDDVLLDQLEQVIEKSDNDQLIVLHQMGSHGPSYHQRYRANERRFTPTCDTNSIQDCDTASLVNTYDNTVVKTDALLDGTIKLLETYQDKFAVMMVYVSDHGESLGENGLYLHGTPYAIAPSQQTHVPMLMWMSKDYQAYNKVDMNCLQQNAKSKPYSHDNIFHTLLGIFNVQTQEYQSSLDILSQCQKAN